MNLALDGLPTFTCLPEDRGQYGATIHLLPDEDGRDRARSRAGFADGAGGRARRVPDHRVVHPHAPSTRPCRTTEGRHNSALFVQWVPYELSGGRRWEDEEARYVKHLLVDLRPLRARDRATSWWTSSPLTPPKIEQHFGITRGHIHHVDNTLRLRPTACPTRRRSQGLYSCSAGCHPAGSVIGAAGHNCATRV